MDKKRAMKRAVAWLLVVGVLVALVVLVTRNVTDWDGTKAEWSQAIIQAMAALGGLWFWAFRSRPRVTLRRTMSDAVYLELANVGNREAKQVQVKCEPPIAMSTVQAEDFGPVEGFGDMDRDQRYVVPLGSPGSRLAASLDAATFEVSHERNWWFGRRRSTMRLCGSGARRSVRDDAATAVGQIAKAATKRGHQLDKIEKTIGTVGRRLIPPDEGGDDFDLKACSTCGWERFTYYRSSTTTTFLCANCREEYKNEACDCSSVYWCEHRPAPRQCVRRSS